MSDEMEVIVSRAVEHVLPPRVLEVLLGEDGLTLTPRASGGLVARGPRGAFESLLSELERRAPAPSSMWSKGVVSSVRELRTALGLSLPLPSEGR